LNRDNNKHKNKVFIKTDSIIPSNFYEANYNYEYSQNSPGDKILIVRNSPNLEDGSYDNLDDIKFVKRISSNTVKNLKRIYYLYESTYK